MCNSKNIFILLFMHKLKLSGFTVPCCPDLRWKQGGDVLSHSPGLPQARGCPDTMKYLGWRKPQEADLNGSVRKLISSVPNFHQDSLLHCLLKILHLTYAQPKCLQPRRTLVTAAMRNISVQYCTPFTPAFCFTIVLLPFLLYFSPPLFIVVL